MQNNKRHYKKFKKRTAEITKQKIEQLAAAFLKETGIAASQARLCQTTDVIDGQPVVRVWFEALPERANLADAHEDVQYQADLLFSIHAFAKDKPVAAWSLTDQNEVQSWLAMVSEHITKYEDQTTVVMP